MDERTLVGLGAARIGREPSRLDRLLYAPAVCDWVLAGYFFVAIVELSRARASEARDQYLSFAFACLTLFLGGVYLFRLRFERGRQARYGERLAYHALPLVALLSFYFNLRAILPIVNPALFDENLYQLDIRVFGVEPTLLVEQYSTRAVVEWFAFFYYSYFFLIASFVLVMILTVEDDERLSHFATGITLITCIGHFFYTLVPGFGPYEHLAHEYQGPLAGGVFYGLVLNAVDQGGPLRDIFPSLHTAMPTFCALFAWRHYRRLAPLITFFAANIMVATVVLRWHYAADVVAGLALAVTAFVVAPHLVEAYQARRAEVGLPALRRW
jgi:membrane-associated phospholipid phosphatase